MKPATFPSLTAALLLAAYAPAASAEADLPQGGSGAIGADLSYSVDGDDTEVVKTGLDVDLRYKGPDDYLGLRIERAAFSALGQGWQSEERAYLRMADNVGRWKLNGRVGTDRYTILGAANIHNNAPARQEYFIERDIIETPQGLKRRIYYTFAGAVFDLPVDERNLFTLMTGLQSFTGKNVRTHIRANYIHVIDPEKGLSAQLRTRYFRSSDPGEVDYYSPRWRAEILPVLQLRRVSGGWRYLAAAGLGIQRDSETNWRNSQFLNLQATSPVLNGNWSFNGALTYSNTPVTSRDAYSYLQFSLGLRKWF